MDLGLQGKHAIVTGGSRGIGKAIDFSTWKAPSQPYGGPDRFIA